MLAGLDRADVGLVDRCLQLHVPEVGGDDEQHRRLQRGGNRLAGIDRARQNDAVDGRIDGAFGEVRLLRLEIGIGDGQIGFGAVERCL
jgi:hypothetical protein